MSLATGAKSALRVKEETSYGVAPSGNWEEMSFNSESLQNQINTVISNEVKANRTVGSIRGGNKMAGGSIGMDVYSSKLGLFYRHLLRASAVSTTVTVAALSATTLTRGTYVSSNTKVYVAVNGGAVTAGDVTTGLTHTTGEVALTNVTFQYVCATAASVYQHLLVGDADLPTVGLAFEKSVKGSTAQTYFPYLGGRVGEMNFQIPQEGIVTIDMAMLFKSGSDGSVSSLAGTPTSTADEPVTGFNTEIVVNSVVQSIIQSGSIRITNNLDANAFVVGSRSRKDIPLGRREVTGSLTQFFEDLTAYNLFIGETSFPILASFLYNGCFTEISMPECKFTGGTPQPQIAGNGTVTCTYNFNAYLDSGAHDVRIKLCNLVATI